jgi:hypothetical protein
MAQQMGSNLIELLLKARAQNQGQPIMQDNNQSPQMGSPSQGIDSQVQQAAFSQYLEQAREKELSKRATDFATSASTEDLLTHKIASELNPNSSSETTSSQQPGTRSLPKGPLGAFYPGSDTEQPGGIYKLLTLLAGGGGYNPTNEGNKQGTKGVYGFDPVKGKLTQISEVPANADIRNLTSQTGIDALPTDLQLPAYALARKMGGRNAEKILPSIISGLLEGKSPDQLEDEIRFSQQSIGVSGEWRNAAQSILGTKTTESQRNVVLDTLDDYRQNGDDKGAKEYLKNIARESAPVDMQNRIMGKERTIDFLDEIQNDLNTLEKSGVGTGFLRGNINGLLNRIGKSVSPEFQGVATKIAVAVINYRNAMSGVAFGEKESKDYRRMFPAQTDNLGEISTPKIKALRESFKGDTEKFYQQRMGEGNYKKLFANVSNDAEILQGMGFNPDEYEIVRE